MEIKKCVLSPLPDKNEKECKINGKYHWNNPLNVGDSLLKAQMGQLEKTRRNTNGNWSNEAFAGAIASIDAGEKVLTANIDWGIPLNTL